MSLSSQKSAEDLRYVFYTSPTVVAISYWSGSDQEPHPGSGKKFESVSETQIKTFSPNVSSIPVPLIFSNESLSALLKTTIFKYTSL